jgi:hypothetical protein
MSLSLAIMRCLSKEWNAIVNEWLVVNKVATGRSQLHISVKNNELVTIVIVLVEITYLQ